MLNEQNPKPQYKVYAAGMTDRLDSWEGWTRRTEGGRISYLEVLCIYLDERRP